MSARGQSIDLDRYGTLLSRMTSKRLEQAREPEIAYRLCSNILPGGLGAVSYTHLDVYKRQI